MRKTSNLIFGLLLLAAMPASAFFAWSVATPASQEASPALESTNRD